MFKALCQIIHSALVARSELPPIVPILAISLLCNRLPWCDSNDLCYCAQCNFECSNEHSVKIIVYPECHHQLSSCKDGIVRILIPSLSEQNGRDDLVFGRSLVEVRRRREHYVRTFYLIRKQTMALHLHFELLVPRAMAICQVERHRTQEPTSELGGPDYDAFHHRSAIRQSDHRLSTRISETWIGEMNSGWTRWRGRSRLSSLSQGFREMTWVRIDNSGHFMTSSNTIPSAMAFACVQASVKSTRQCTQ
jgi:hypothetical protein